MKRGARSIDGVPAKLVFQDGTEIRVLVEIEENLVHAGHSVIRGYPSVTARGDGGGELFERLWQQVCRG